jgi:hypothetical protein
MMYLLMALICLLVYFVVKDNNLGERALEADERGDRKRRERRDSNPRPPA